MENTVLPKAKVHRLMRLATIASTGTAFLLVLGKAVAYWMSGSTAVLGSLLDSVLDFAASLINMFAVRISLEDADDEHRFGHGKAEALGALIQGGLISGSAVFLAIEAIGKVLDPEPVTAANVGILVMGGSIFATVCLVMFQRYVVRRTGSVAIEADSLHYIGDVAVNGAVILALVLGMVLDDALWLDPLFGFAIAIWLGKSAYEVFLTAVHQLMDRELPDSVRQQILENAVRVPRVSAVHDLRTRQSGVDTFIQLHVEVDGGMSLYQAHVIAETVEMEVEKVHPGADVLVHLDPAGAEDFVSERERVTLADQTLSSGTGDAVDAADGAVGKGS